MRSGLKSLGLQAHDGLQCWLWRWGQSLEGNVNKSTPLDQRTRSLSVLYTTYVPIIYLTYDSLAHQSSSI